MRRCLWTAIGIVAAVVVLVSASGARAASRPVYVAASCPGQGAELGGHSIRPRTVYFACGGTMQFVATGVSFSAYGGQTAVGRGTVSFVACSAACGRTYRHETGTFTLSRIRLCSDGRLYYTSARIDAPGEPSRPVEFGPARLSCRTPTRNPGRVVLDYLHAFARGDFAAACGDFTESLRSDLIRAAHAAGVKAKTCRGVIRAGWLELSAGHRRQLDTILDHATIEQTTIDGTKATVVARVGTVGSSRKSSTKVALARVSGVWKITSNHGSGAPGA